MTSNANVVVFMLFLGFRHIKQKLYNRKFNRERKSIASTMKIFHVDCWITTEAKKSFNNCIIEKMCTLQEAELRKTKRFLIRGGENRQRSSFNTWMSFVNNQNLSQKPPGNVNVYVRHRQYLIPTNRCRRWNGNCLLVYRTSKIHSRP